MKKTLLFCHPLSTYHEPPKKKEKYNLLDCPHCENKMWVSERKEELLNLIENITLVCSICFQNNLDNIIEHKTL